MASPVSTYFARHTQAALSSLGHLARNPFATLLTVMVIALALSLPMGLRLVITNARAATGNFSNAVDLSVYFRSNVSVDKAEQLARNARARPGISEVTLVRSDEALEEFRKYSGFGAALEALQNNPLPHVLVVHPDADHDGPAQLELLKRYFAAWPEVELVQMDTEWVQRFSAILDVLRAVVLVAAVVLATGVLAVIGNTIRLEILNRRGEIEVTKLVGGSNAFVRRPFLYTGVLYGLIGALLAWGIIALAVMVMDGPVANLARLYGSRFVLLGLSAKDVGYLLAGGLVLGWLGAWASAARQLSAIEPRA
jgi:cell division transport system permease protein